jgi:GTP-binding protein
VLLHLVDATGEDPATAWKTVREELAEYGAGLAEKPEILALNKVDLLDEELTEALSAELAETSGEEVLPLSGATGEGLDAVLDRIVAALGETGETDEDEEEESEAWTPLD